MRIASGHEPEAELTSKCPLTDSGPPSDFSSAAPWPSSVSSDTGAPCGNVQHLEQQFNALAQHIDSKLDLVFDNNQAIDALTSALGAIHVSMQKLEARMTQMSLATSAFADQASSAATAAAEAAAL